MIQSVVSAIDANISTLIATNVKNYGVCSEVERESQDGNGVNRYLIDSEGNAAVTDDNFEVGSAHILTTTNCEYRNNAFDILEIAEMQLLVWITNGLYNQHDIYRQFRDVIFATEVKNELAKNIQLIPTKANFKSTEIFRNNYNYFRGNRTQAVTPMNMSYISITYNILAQYAKGKLNCLECLTHCKNGSIS